MPDLQTHFLTSSLPSTLDSLPLDCKKSIQPRSMQVRRLRIFPIESIVRGYITGSAWTEYQKSQTINGIPLPAGLVNGDKLPVPLWTPSTKADSGDTDENISPEQARKIVGGKLGRIVEKLSLEIYSLAAKRAEETGIILADTKLEFGTDEQSVVLVDEVLTPDSSRFWAKDTWKQNLGKQQPSFDKQYLRDWLTANELGGKNGVTIPKDVITKTKARYHEAWERIVDQKL
ncbi:MAG: Bifunctional purine biosynthetic protein ade1 [Stictis urceolatum]|nr:Bifunctional purine biosynthetic protein ade1 [Stictis urceolata]